VGFIGLVATALYRAIFQAVLGPVFLAGLQGTENGPWRVLVPYLQGGLGFVSQVAMGPIALVISLFLVSAVTHVALMLLGGAHRPFEATFRVLCFAEAAAVLNLVPFCGNLVGGVYLIVMMVIGLGEAHGIGRGKALLAVLLPMIVICCCFCGALAALVGGIAAIGGAATH
jgi:hypothetical protein